MDGLMASMPRDEQGKFKKCSPFGQRNFVVRLPKEHEKIILQLAKETDYTPTKILREAIALWLKEKNISSS